MAFLDFLGKDIGGYKPGGTFEEAQYGTGIGSTVKGPGVTGVNWGDLLGAAMKYGSKPGSTGPAFGSTLMQQYGSGMGQPQQQQMGSQLTAGLQQPQQEKKQDSLGALVNLAASLFFL